MVTLSYNPCKLRNHKPQSHKPISCLSKPIEIPFSLSQFSTLYPSKFSKLRLNTLSESSVSLPTNQPPLTSASENNFNEDEDVDDDPTSKVSYLDSETDPESIIEWELDFCSRPILDIRGKKIW
ncbi:Tab2-like protein [Thalictrum thalictroides]|uniref:Tab2-like protein n=1 Tax=Thalictrum thalictroides TaxID=46969 RepID=A0A7J6WFR2_THATH|nr:Tab2-like protein [Thalictrum thalictroides]